MTTADAQTIIAIAALAAQADGHQSDAERENIHAAAARLGLPSDDPRLKVGPVDTATIASLVASLSNDEAKLAAYDTAAAVCQVDGVPNPAESAFLTELSRALGAVPGLGESQATLGAAGAVATGGRAPAGDLDSFILDQAMLAGAAELLPHRLSGMAILPLQLRMVYSIGQKHGQQFDLDQAKDLAATVGIGAAGHMMEGIVRGVLGKLGKGLLGGLLGGATGAAAGVAVTFATTYALGHAAEQYYAQGRQLSATVGIGAAGHMMEGIVRGVLGKLGKGLLGGLLGGATGAAAGVAVTFATTYALGHAAEQYYAQGRQLSATDLKTLFTRFQGEANTVFPKVEARIRELATTRDLSSLLAR